MKDLVTAATATKLASNNLFSWAHCWQVKRPDGVVKRATEHDEDIPLALAGDLGTLLNGTYLAATGGSASSTRTAADLSGSGFNVDGILGDVSEEDLRARRYGGAEVHHFLVDWTDPNEGIIPLSASVLGQVTLRRGAWVAEMRRLPSFFNNSIGEVWTPACPAQVGGPRCKLRVVAPVWTTGASAEVRLAQDEASVLKTDSDLSPFAKLTVVRPTSFIGREFKCIAAGTTDVSEPAWPTIIGNTVVDGGATWEAIQPRRWEGRITGVTDQRTLVFTAQAHTSITGLANLSSSTVVFAFGSATAQAGDMFYFDADGPEFATRVLSGGASLTLAEPYLGPSPVGTIASGTTLQTSTAGVVAVDAADDWFGAGLADFRTGLNRNQRREIQSWDLASTTLGLRFGFPQTIAVGDQVTLLVGCRKRREDCRDKHENTKNNRAAYDVPTALLVFKDQSR